MIAQFWHDVAVQLPVIQILRDTSLASSFRHDDVFVASGPILIGQLVQHVGSDKIGTLHNRHTQNPSNVTIEDPGILITLLEVPIRLDVGVVIGIAIIRPDRAKKRRSDRQIEGNQFAQCAGANKIIHVDDEKEIALMIPGAVQADVAQVPQRSRTRWVPIVTADILFIGLDLDGGVGIADPAEPVPQEAFRVVGTVVDPDG